MCVLHVCSPFRFVVFDRNAGTGAAGVDDSHVVPADLPLDIGSVLLAQLVGIAAGDLPLASVQDPVDQDGVGDDEVRQEEVGFGAGAAADIVRVALLEGPDVADVHAVGRVVVGHRHAFEGGDRLRRKHFLRRSIHRDQGSGDPSASLGMTRSQGGGDPSASLGMTRRRQTQLLGQVFLGAGAGNGHVQAEEVTFRLTPRYVF